MREKPSIHDLIDEALITGREYTSEKTYVAFLAECLSKWFVLTPSVRAMHYSGRILKYDFVAVPCAKSIAEQCQFDWLVIEVKHHLYDKEKKDIWKAYFQSYEYRNAVIIDERFRGTKQWDCRPPAVCLCSDCGRLWESHVTHDLSRGFGRRGVYAMTADPTSVVCFTDHGTVFDICRANLNPAFPVSVTPEGHTSLKFASGISDWEAIKFLLTTDSEAQGIASRIYEDALQCPRPIMPENALDEDYLNED